MSEYLLPVAGPNGTVIRKARKDLLPNDEIVFDGVDCFASTQKLHAELLAEIEAAGGLEQWRSRRLGKNPNAGKP